MLSESVKVDKETMDQLRKLKKQEGIQMSFIIKKSIEEYFDRHRKDN